MAGGTSLERPRCMSKAAAVVLAASGVVLLQGAGSAETPQQTRGSESPRVVQIEMKNVRLHVDQWVVLDVERLRGVMISTLGLALVNVVMQGASGVLTQYATRS